MTRNHLLHPRLTTNSAVYIRLKALTWAANRAVLPTIAQDAAGAALSAVIRSSEPEKCVVVNCEGVTSVDDHGLAHVRPAIGERSTAVLFIRADALLRQFTGGLGKWVAEYNNDPDGAIVVYAKEPLPPDQVKRIVDEAIASEKLHLKTIIGQSFVRHPDKPQRLQSTPLLASGVFNARLLISNREHFVWLALNLARELERLVDTDHPRSPVLLAVSLRGSPFAAAVSILSQAHMPLEVVDHLGPRHKILEEPPLESLAPGRDVILVADFVIGGTELKIARTYAQLRGCDLTHVIALGCALSPEHYGTGTRILPLVDLKSCAPAAQYQFSEEWVPR